MDAPLPNTDTAAADDPPLTRLYADRHAAKIRHYHKRGMSRRMLDQIYGHLAVHQVLGAAEPELVRPAVKVSR